MASTGTSVELNKDDWMQWFLGAEEPDVIRWREKFVSDDGRCFVNSNFMNQGKPKAWAMGSFQQPSVAELREQVQLLPSVRSAGSTCPLNVVDGVDIGAYQAAIKNEDKAMVQIASNFHCLENGQPRISADYGYLVTRYCSDSTQGPAASFGVPAASLLRAHYAFMDRDRPPEEWGQSASRQVSLIQDISRWCGSCVNGKALLTGKEEPVTPELLNDIASRVRVGLHSDCGVVFDRVSSRWTIRVVEDPQLLDQVCSATICYGFVDKDVRASGSFLESLARALLRAAYEGAYLAAIKRERRVLLLTLIGGACFGNPMPVILQELKRAHEIWASHPASKLEEVRLLIYGKGEGQQYEQALDRIDVSSL